MGLSRMLVELLHAAFARTRYALEKLDFRLQLFICSCHWTLNTCARQRSSQLINCKNASLADLQFEVNHAKIQLSVIFIHELGIGPAARGVLANLSSAKSLSAARP